MRYQDYENFKDYCQKTGLTEEDAFHAVLQAISSFSNSLGEGNRHGYRDREIISKQKS